MIGAKMIANGAMGTMNRSVWMEGSIAGTGELATNIMRRAIRELMDTITVDITVEGVGPTRIVIEADSTPLEVGAEFAKLRIGGNVLGLVANAIRSHNLSGGSGVLDIVIDL